MPITGGITGYWALQFWAERCLHLDKIFAFILHRTKRPKIAGWQFLASVTNAYDPTDPLSDIALGAKDFAGDRQLTYLHLRVESVRQPPLRAFWRNRANLNGLPYLRASSAQSLPSSRFYSSFV